MVLCNFQNLFKHMANTKKQKTLKRFSSPVRLWYLIVYPAEIIILVIFGLLCHFKPILSQDFVFLLWSTMKLNGKKCCRNPKLNYCNNTVLVALHYIPWFLFFVLRIFFLGCKVAFCHKQMVFPSTVAFKCHLHFHIFKHEPIT